MNHTVGINDADLPRLVEMADAAGARRADVSISADAWAVVIGRCSSLIVSGMSFTRSQSESERLLAEYMMRQGRDILLALGVSVDEIEMIIKDCIAEAAEAALQAAIRRAGL